MEEENGNSLQYSCLENPMDRARQAPVRGVAKSQTRPSTYTSSEGKHASRLHAAPRPPPPGAGTHTGPPRSGRQRLSLE